MSIASRITEIETHIGDIYDELEIGGADLTNVNKNIVNIKNQLIDRYLDYLNNGTQEIWDNWEKVTGTGTILNLTPTEYAPMKIDLKGNTSQTGTPTPTSPQPVHVVSGDNVLSICGKNLCDGVLEQGAYNTSDGYTNISSNKYVRTPNFTILQPNTQYTLNFTNSVDSKKGSILFYGKNKNFLSQLNISNNLTFTTSSDTYFLRLDIYSSNDITPSNITNLQIEKGNQATIYEPYIGQDYHITLPTGMELCKIGTYQDYIYKEDGNWYLYKNIGKVVLDENNNMTTYTYNNMLGVNFINALSTQCLRAVGVCNYSNKVGQWSSNSIWIGVVDKNIYWLNILNLLNISTIEDFKTWIANNNVIIYYVLATPTTTEITDTTLIGQLEALKNATSYENQTNISQVNNDLPFILNVSALKKEV